MLEKRTEASQTFANPDGTFTLEQDSVPVRVQRGADWVDIDTTLERAADGRVRPRATAMDMAFSGGGSGPLISVKSQGYELKLSLPDSLPTPTLEDDSALYSNVYPDVDLKVTASADSYSEVLIVKTPEAARLPQLQRLELAMDAPGLTVAKVAGGVIEARDDLGALVFTGPQPIAWDSRGEAKAPTDDDRAEAPLEGDKIAQLPVAVTQDALTISPATALVNDPATEYPLHIDPTLSFAQEGRAMINERYPTTSSWNWAGPEGVGFQSFEPWSRKRLIYKMRLGSLTGAQITSATFSAFETWAASCTKKEVQAWQLTPIGTGVNWSNGTQAGVWKRNLDSAVDAVGRPECTQGGKWLEFDVKAAVAEEAAASKSYVYLGLRAASESDDMAWKRFRKDVKLVVIYNTVPKLASARFTEPTATCSTDVTKPSRLNNTQPVLHLQIVDPDRQTSFVQFEIWRNGKDAPSQTVNSSTKVATSTIDYTPSPRMNPVRVNEVVGWRGRANDGVTWSAYSGMCWFIVDVAAPPAPRLEIADTGEDPVFLLNDRISVYIKETQVDQNYFRYTVDGDEPTSVNLPNENHEASFRRDLTKTGPMVFRAWAYDRSGNQSGVAELEITVKTADSEGGWRIDEGDGSTLADSSGLRRPMTLSGGASWLPGDHWQEADLKKDWSVRLPPTDSAASAMTNMLDTSHSFTVSARVRLSDQGGRRIAFSEDGAGTSGFTLGAVSQDLSDPDNRTVVWGFSLPGADGTETAIVRSDVSPYVAGDWVYLVGRYDERVRSMKLDVIDSLAHTFYAKTAPSAPVDRAGVLRLGVGSVSGTTYPLDGQIDDVRTYPGVIDDDAIFQDDRDSSPN
ncbi:LamG-like jellyroll fold domain-containing protein [Kribbella sp. NPDC058245]|uniref:LamG-like jellyroll fold domain-containing protein n=1 Tax=Kribbella sp. NPDC058245 TaxID=3346399 RepID=UPI0036ECFE4C